MATTTDCLGSSPSPTKPTTPNHRSPSYTQTQRGVQNDTCFHCRNRGHWAANCPFRSPLQSQSLSQSQYLSQSQSLSQSPNSDTSIPCPYGHGSCFVKISQSRANPGRRYYSCDVCKFFKWQEELDLESGGGGGSNSNSNSKAWRDRAQDSYPDCLCGAGKCEIVQERTGKYFVCPIQKGHGACSFRTAVFCTQPPKTAMSDFKEDSQGGCLSPKRMKFDSPVVENPDQMSTPVGPSPRIEEVAIESDNYGDILDMSTIQEMVMEDGETDVLLMEKSLQISRLPTKANQRRQIEFLRQISASEDATSAGIFLHGCGALIPGWLGRLAFPPSGCVTIPQAKPFFCCVFPSLDPISIPKGVDTFNSGALNDQPHTPFNAEPDSSLQISSLDSQSGILLGLSSILNVPGIRQGRDFTRQISRALVEVGVHVQSQLLTILDSTESRNHRSMMEAADKTFSLLNQLSVDHRSFSEHVRKFISCTSSLAKIEESMMAGQSSEEIMEWYDYERANFDKLSRMQAETEDAVTASDKRLKSLGEEASRLKRMLLQVEDQWRHCEKENAELKTRSRKISKDILELEKKLQEAETAKRLHEEREMERNAAKISLEMARIQLRQSVFKV